MSAVGQRTGTAAVVALKSATVAKSRLDVYPDPLRRRLAWAMAVDTLRALAEGLDQVLIVSRQPALASRLSRHGLDVEVLAETGPGDLNGALRQGADVLARAGFGGVCACVGDLPALTAEAVRAVLAASAAHPRSFVADAAGTGTTMLISHRADLDPHFGGRSAAAHRASGAAALEVDGLVRARRDVDTEIDLADALRLGVGPTTGALIDPATGRIGTYDVVTAIGWQAPDGTPQAVTRSGYRVALPGAALDDGLQHARLGQRLHAVIADRAVLSAWF